MYNIISYYDCDIILRETKIKGQHVTENVIKNPMETFPVSDLQQKYLNYLLKKNWIYS